MSGTKAEADAAIVVEDFDEDEFEEFVADEEVRGSIMEEDNPKARQDDWDDDDVDDEFDVKLVAELKSNANGGDVEMADTPVSPPASPDKVPEGMGSAVLKRNSKKKKKKGSKKGSRKGRRKR